MPTFYIQHGQASGPFRTEAVDAREDWRPQPKRGDAIACRFLVKYNGRWRRLYSQRGHAIPHFINSGNERLRITGVCP